MAKTYSYQKVIDNYTSHTLIEPDYEQAEDGCGRVVELCTIDNATYVYVPGTIALPAQPEKITKTLKPVVLDEALRKQIREKSPHYRLVLERVNNLLPNMSPAEGRYFMYSFDPVKMDAEKNKYGLNAAKNLKEAMLPHIAASDGYADEVVRWGNDQKSRLGL